MVRTLSASRALLVVLVPLVAFAAAGAARAEGLVQLAFFGSIDTPGGAIVDVTIGIAEGESTRELRLALHLAQTTTAPDVATLLAERLRRARFDVIEPRPAGESASLFIDGVRFVETQLGHGLSVSVTTCEQAPSRVRLAPPPVANELATLLVGVSTWRAHTSEGGNETLELQFEPGASAAFVSERLATRGIETGWVCERPTLDSWRPSRTIDGRRFTGCSIRLSSAVPWHLRVELPREQG